MNYELENFETLPTDEVDFLLSTQRVGLYSQFSHFADSTKITKYEIDQLKNSLRLNQKVMGVFLNDKLVAMAVLAPLDFDSDFFGFPMGTVKRIIVSNRFEPGIRRRAITNLIEEIISQAKDFGFHQITLRVPPTDHDIVQACIISGFEFIDVVVTYAISMSKLESHSTTISPEITIRTKKETDMAPLMHIARHSFVQDRFHSDINFNRDNADQFHSTWIENSLHGKIADDVIVAELDNKPVGFTTLRKNRELSDALGVRSGSMILSAVDENARGKGVYRNMIAGGLRWFQNKADIVDLGTQIDNLPVQRAWCGLGFKPVAHMVTMHWWSKST